MPIYSGSFPYKTKFEGASSNITPSDHEFLSAFQHSIGASEQQLQNINAPAAPISAAVGATLPIGFANQVQHAQNVFPYSQAASALHLSSTLPASSSLEQVQAPKISSLSAANQLAFSNAAAQFAAGFAAAMGMLAPQTGPGPQMFDSMMTNNNIVAAEALGPLSHHDGDFVAKSPIPPMQHSPTAVPTNVALADGNDMEQLQFFSVDPPILPQNELKPPPT